MGDRPLFLFVVSRPGLTRQAMSRLLAAVLLGALLLTACSNEDEPEIPPTASAPQPEEPDEPDEAEEPDEPEEPEDTRPFSPFTGERVEQEVHDRPLLMAKVDNHPRARPQTALDAADIVYEEVVEGGLTRFFVLLHSQVPDALGPIRSARPVDTQLMSGYGSSGFAYSGARAEVQAMLSGTPSIRVTEGGPGFYRDRSRRAPHNLYVRPPDMLMGIIERGAEALDDVGWVFEDEVPAGAVRCPAAASDCEQPGGQIDIRMSYLSTTGWEYDRPGGVYRRSQNGQPFLVTGDGRIGAANVVVLAARHYIGASGYPETDVTTDDAAAAVLRDGRLYAARWAKSSATDPLRILTPGGEPFPLKPGPTWLHLSDTAGLPSFDG